MKNVHLLSTNKPSRLWTNNLRRRLELDEFPEQHLTNIAKHLYITNNEEIKEGDWMYDIDGDIGKAMGSDITEFEGNKKIIITTDPDLIKDGVQAIDDEFLEWFVKNPTCESVEVQKWASLAECGYSYHIIIPQEKPKQETLEEAAEKYSQELLESKTIQPHEKTWIESIFSQGAKWQAERMYSEEDLKEAFRGGRKTSWIKTDSFEEWFEKFKKK